MVYDAVTCWKGKFFKLDKHIERLWTSLRIARIEPPFSKQEAKQIFIEVVKRNSLIDANVWVYISYGVPSGGGYWGTARPAKPTVLSVAIPHVWFGGAEGQKAGTTTIISSIRSIPAQSVDPRLKHVNRLHMNLADLEARSAHVDAPILLDIDGYVTENNFSNVFAVKHGRIYTPSEGILLGITRETLLEIAHREKIPAFEARLRPYDLFDADEVFLSSSSAGTVPVVEISGRKIGDGKPGPVTQNLAKLYWEMRERGEYSTPVYQSSKSSPNKEC